MNCEVLKNQARDLTIDILIKGSNVVRALGDFALWYGRDLENPDEATPTPASIQYHPEQRDCERRWHE